jgi:hypothetical protein
LRRLLSGCTGYDGFRLTSVSGRLKEAADGRSFDSTTRHAFTFRAQGHSVRATLVTRVHGELLADELAAISRAIRTPMGAATDATVPRELLQQPPALETAGATGGGSVTWFFVSGVRCIEEGEDTA